MNTLKALSNLSMNAQFWAWAVFLTIARLIVLVFTEANLGPDEAQYWYWSQDFAFGYFSKPPFIAWVIGATTALFGNDEWAVRLAAPLFHLGVAGFLFAIARRLYDDHVGFWTGVAWLTLPGVLLSSFVITTDAPLLFFWSASLYLLFELLRADEKQQSTLVRAALLGAALGLAFLSKYAALYFLAALAICFVINRTIRDAFHWRAALACLIVFIAVITPNVIWNAQHDFQTVGHTVENANWSVSLFRPLNLISFWGAQFAVFGLFLAFALIGVANARFRKALRLESNSATLIVFALTPLIIVSAQALLSRAHANWAAAAYPATTILVVRGLIAARAVWAVKASIGAHSILLLFFSMGMLNLSLADKVGLAKATREIRGWEAQTAAIADRAEDFVAIMIDDRNLLGEMLYYRRDRSPNIVAWDPNARITNHYEAFIPYDPEKHSRVLFVTTRSDDAHVNYRFQNITPMGSIRQTIGADQSRQFHLFDVSGYQAPN